MPLHLVETSEIFGPPVGLCHSYVSDGAWRDAHEGARAGVGSGATLTARTRHGGPGDGNGEAAETQTQTHAAANDNAIVRVAEEIRHAVAGWRYGAAVDAFAAERTRVLSA